VTAKSDPEASGGVLRREGVQVIARAAEMLRRLAAEPEGLPLGDLATKVGLPRSTVHRIVRALVDEGFVRTTPSGKLRIGPGLIGIAVSDRRDLRHEAAPFLERLSQEVHETVDLAVLDGGEVLFIDQYSSRRSLRVVSEIGARLPLYCTANGKALLAALPPDEAARLLPRQLRAMTANTVTDRVALSRELAEIRKTGLAFDREEQNVGIVAIGTAVQDAAGTLAAVTVAMPTAHLTPDVRSHIETALLKTADEMQAVLRGD
jgi:DNA-binding IclR family transcriptional regulator